MVQQRLGTELAKLRLVLVLQAAAERNCVLSTQPACAVAEPVNPPASPQQRRVVQQRLGTELAELGLVLPAAAQRNCERVISVPASGASLKPHQPGSYLAVSHFKLLLAFFL